MMARFKAEQIISPTGNLVLISVLYQLLLDIGDSIFWGGSKLGYEVLDISGVDTNKSGCRADGDFILDHGN